MIELTAQRATTTIARRLADTSMAVWDADEVLEALDHCMEFVYTSMVQAGSDHNLDSLVIGAAEFTNPEEGVFTYVLPSWVGAVRQVWAVKGTILRPFDVDQVDFQNQHAFRGFWDRGFPVWVRGEYGRLRIVGRVSGFDPFTVWYQRKWMPFHYGAAREASAGPSTTAFRFSSTPTGRVVQIDDSYIGMQVEFSSGNVDFTSRITDYDGATQEVILEDAAPVAIQTGDTYSLVVPIPTEHADYLKELVVHKLLEEKSNDVHIATLMPRLQRLEERFFSGLRQRDNARPRKIYSRRGVVG